MTPLPPQALRKLRDLAAESVSRPRPEPPRRSPLRWGLLLVLLTFSAVALYRYRLPTESPPTPSLRSRFDSIFQRVYVPGTSWEAFSRELDSLLREAPADSTAGTLFVLGRIHHELGKREHAKAFYEQAIETSSSLPEAHLWLGLLLYEEERPETPQDQEALRRTAFQHFSFVLWSPDESIPRSWKRLAEAHLARINREYGKADRIAREELAQNRNAPGTEHFLRLLIRLPETRDTLELEKQALALRPLFPDLRPDLDGIRQRKNP